MSTAPGEPRAVELEDVQGLVRTGYGRLKEACFLLLRVTDAGAARTWLEEVAVTNAADVHPRPPTAIHVAFTRAGLAALEVPEDVCADFSAEFHAGMASDDARARRLGDVDGNDPRTWEWGAADKVPHVAVLLYAECGALASWERDVTAQYAAGFQCLARLGTAPGETKEPFGFDDGISQPDVDWERRRPVRDQDRLTYDDRTCLGEFLLGYPNEYGLYTPRPLLAPERDPEGCLPRAEDAPDRADLGRNGCYLVIRQLEQQVAGFWGEVGRHANGDAAEAERLAAAMVGRRKDGTPLVGTGDRNAFTYDDDPEGLRCPLGAHIRRVNPRNADLPPGAPGLLSRLCRMLGFDVAARRRDLVASARFHRLLRRGRSHDTGIHFVCLVANIKRQFEFVQSAWLMGSTFDRLRGESDPLLGHRRPDLGGLPTDAFSLPQSAGPDRRLSGLPSFVTVRGGAYFFLPGIRALKFLARAAGKGA